MQQLMPEIMATPNARLRFHSREALRFADQDIQGHINNSVYSTLLECSRVSFQTTDSGFALAPGQVVVIAALSIEFLRELHWPGAVDIWLGVTRIGRSSFGFQQEVWLGDTLVATARSTQVVVDQQARKSMPLTDIQRQRLQAWHVDS